MFFVADLCLPPTQKLSLLKLSELIYNTKNMFVQILIICNVKVNVSPLKLTSSLLSYSK